MFECILLIFQKDVDKGKDVIMMNILVWYYEVPIKKTLHFLLKISSEISFLRPANCNLLFVPCMARARTPYDSYFFCVHLAR